MKASKITTFFGVAVILYGLLAAYINWIPFWHFKAPHHILDCWYHNLLVNGKVMGAVAVMVAGVALMFAADHRVVKAHFHKHGLK